MGIFSDAIQVQCAADGRPQRLLWHGKVHDIGLDSLCWHQRRAWWECDSRMPPGSGADAVDTEMWRLHLVAEDGGEGPTLDVAHYRSAGRWRVIKIHAAIEAASEEELDGA